MNFVKQHKLTVGILAGAGVAALFLAACHYRKNRCQGCLQNSTKDPSRPYSSSHPKHFQKEKAYLERISALKLSIDAEKEQGQFSRQTISEIIRAIFQLSNEKLVEIFRETRQKRRKQVSSISGFAHEFFKGIAERDKILESAKKEVLRDLEMDLAFYQNEFWRASQKDQSLFLLWQFLLEEAKNKTKEKPKGNPKLTKEQVLEYLKFQKSQFEHFNFSEMREFTPEILMLCKQQFLADLAALEFGMEEEDLLDQKAILSDLDVLEKQGQLQNLFIEEKQNLVSFPY